MDLSKLKTTLRAYKKVSPSILEDYVKKEDLETTLENYVTEAPTDGKIYGRKDKAWIALKEAVALSENMVFYGSNNQLQIDTEEEIFNLDNYATMAAGATSYTVNYNQAENGYLWIVCTAPIKSILWGAMGLIADYVEQQAQIISKADPNISYWCYRIRDELVANQWVFNIHI